MDNDPDTIFPRQKTGRDRQIRDMFRNGKVIDRKTDEKRGPLVRVQYLDRQGLISQWIPVKQFGSRATTHFYVPKIGDDVNVTMLPNGSEDGFVDGSFFNAGNPPPAGVDIDTRHYQSEDGTIIEYREKDRIFNLDATGSGGTVQITAPLIIINGFIQHNGAMVTTGIHTDANGIHMGGMAARIEALEMEVRELRVLINEIKSR